jgi:hypothetical protein
MDRLALDGVSKRGKKKRKGKKERKLKEEKRRESVFEGTKRHVSGGTGAQQIKIRPKHGHRDTKTTISTHLYGAKSSGWTDILEKAEMIFDIVSSVGKGRNDSHKKVLHLPPITTPKQTIGPLKHESSLEKKENSPRKIELPSVHVGNSRVRAIEEVKRHSFPAVQKKIHKDEQLSGHSRHRSMDYIPCGMDGEFISKGASRKNSRRQEYHKKSRKIGRRVIVGVPVKERGEKEEEREEEEEEDFQPFSALSFKHFVNGWRRKR